MSQSWGREGYASCKNLLKQILSFVTFEFHGNNDAATKLR